MVKRSVEVALSEDDQDNQSNRQVKREILAIVRCEC